MFSTIKSSMLLDRLDPEFYSIEKIDNQKRLDEFGVDTLATITTAINVGYTGELATVYSKKGAVLYRVSDIDGCFLNEDEVKFVPEDFINKNPQVRVETGDLVFAAVGNTIGKAAINSAAVRNGACSRNLMIVRPNTSKIDPHFLVVYMSSKFGQKSLLRGLSGSAQPLLNTPLIAGVSIPRLELSTQKYIGDKVRQAERLRAWAKAVQALAQEKIPTYGDRNNRYTSKSYVSKTYALSELRLDASFYHPDHISLDKKLQTVGCVHLGEQSLHVKSGWDKSSEKFAYFEIGGLNVSDGTVLPEVVETVDAPSRAKTGIRVGDILVSTVRPNRKNVAFVSQDFSPMPMVATSGFSVLRFSTMEDAALYHAWLRTDDATQQLMRWNSGSAYPAIDDDVPLNLLVPDFDSSFSKSWGKRLLATHAGLLAVKRLVKAAKLLVELLIEGQLTEQQLISAQQAINVDDYSQDRDILARMTTQGIDAEGDPLFPDLDQLYELLAQSQQAEE